MKMKGFAALAASYALVCLLPATAAADSHEQPDLAELWVVVVKDGMDEKFTDAFKKHLKVRAKAKDPRAWQVYTPVIGDDLNHYGIRYCCFTYADMDEYQAWTRDAKTVEDWNANVDPYVESYRHYLQTMDFENSNWPEDAPDYRLYGVTRYAHKMGTNASIEQSKAALSQAAKDGNWPRNWSWMRNVGGSGGLELVVPYADYAAMEPPEEGFGAFLARLHGEEQARKLLGDFSDNFTSSDYTVYRHRPDLSMPE